MDFKIYLRERLLLVNQTPLRRVTSHDSADFNKKFDEEIEILGQFAANLIQFC